MSLTRALAPAGAAAALVLAIAVGTPPAGEPAGAGKARSLTGKTITIDPGHNGRNFAHPRRINRLVPIGNGDRKACDTTGTETAGGYAEHRFAWNVAKRLKRILKRKGARVFLTRKGDDGVGPCITRRARIGNRAHSDAAISIHADGGPSSGRGFHVIRPTKIRGLTDDIYGRSKRLAKRIRGAYDRGTRIPPSNYAGADGIDARSDVGGLRLSNVPKVYVETANMRNAADARILERARGRQRIAEALAAGLRRYLD